MTLLNVCLMRQCHESFEKTSGKYKACRTTTLLLKRLCYLLSPWWTLLQYTTVVNEKKNWIQAMQKYPKFSLKGEVLCTVFNCYHVSWPNWFTSDCKCVATLTITMQNLTNIICAEHHRDDVVVDRAEVPPATATPPPTQPYVHYIQWCCSQPK